MAAQLGFKVKYDSREESDVVKVKPRHLVRYEEKYGELAETATGTYQLCWLASDTGMDFMDWLDTVDSIEALDEEDGKDRPTQ